MDLQIKRHQDQNNVSTYGIAPPYQFLRYYGHGDDKIKTRCGIKFWNVSIFFRLRQSLSIVKESAYIVSKYFLESFST